MNKIFDNAFLSGVSFNVFLFTILNAVSFEINRREYENREIQFAPAGFNWGFPFNWGETYAMVVEAGSILNLAALAFGGLFFGFLFKFVWSKTSRRGALS